MLIQDIGKFTNLHGRIDAILDVYKRQRIAFSLARGFLRLVQKQKLVSFMTAESMFG